MKLAMIALAATAMTVGGQTERLGPTLKATRAFAAEKGDTVWPGYGRAPFGFLLVDGDKEVLLCQPKAPADFSAAGIDAATGCKILTRPRTNLPDTLLAAMPIFGPPTTIVMGPPEAAGATRAEWVRVILHEHFHQYQDAQPGMTARVQALGLAGSDRTGMWMLNYPFPYAEPRAGVAYGEASLALADALEARGSAGFLPALDHYLAKREAFRAKVGETDWRYLEFELWKEGVARWTEIELGRLHPDAEVRQSSDRLALDTLRQLKSPNLAEQKRTAVYPMGAGEAMLVEACRPDWRRDYFAHLDLGHLLKSARAACATRRV